MIAKDLSSKSSRKKTVVLTILFAALALTTYQVASHLSQDGVLSFYKGILRNPSTVGAIVPCSQYVAEESVRYVSLAKQDTVSVLEVGGGTGQFTKTIEKALNKLVVSGSIKNYNVDVIEIDGEYCKELKRMFAGNANIKIHCKDAAVGFGEKKYDFIISSLPFTNIPAGVVGQILENYKSSIKDGGVVSYIKHRFLTTAMSKFLFGKKYAEFKEREGYIKDFRSSGSSLERNTIWRNVIPMFVYHIKF